MSSKRRLTVVKFGGGVIGDSGHGISRIVERVRLIRREDGIGPLVVVSAPRGLTDRVLEIGKLKASGSRPDISTLRETYLKICTRHVDRCLRDSFLEEQVRCFEKAERALDRIGRNREFDAGNRAVILAYYGELCMSVAMHYVFKSNSLDSINVPFSRWPLITDKRFESANFLLRESEKRINFLLERLEEGKVLTMGGFIGRTRSGRETTFERGGSDRSAIDLGVLLKTFYEVYVDLEKEHSVMSADPAVEGIRAAELERIHYLSYNEARLAGQYGMSIVDPVAIRDIQPDTDLVLYVTNILTGERTVIKRKLEAGPQNPLKIVTGRSNCAILELRQSKILSLYDFLEGIRGYHEFTELRPYAREGVRLSRFLFFDGKYLKESLIEELYRIDEEFEVEYGLAAITLVGDGMAHAPGIVASAYQGIMEEHPDMVILDGDVQKPTSSILIIVEQDDKDPCVSAIHGKRGDINSYKHIK